ncbi:helix-turn-helix domain-containing protein [Dyadobacter aurulentus]|uniref:helix-turn-helix domain-containing protein n=1 Tax=Dyadobacter sp. UC 10 TaxID=2605428 RepID=UPI0011F2C188|nr:helix-turn-helix domain-containing protein [Dyadobacter sp. UC 10]KAA0993320.1 AraC family transcriptional regulator [Dyadobacter sp. UC 10]
MNIGKELLFFFSVFGAFNGLLLGLYFFFFTRKKYLVNYMLGALFFALSLRIGKSAFLYFDGKLPRIYLQIGLSACFFIGPFLYGFVSAAVKPIEKFPRSWARGLVALFMLILLVDISWPYAGYPKLWKMYIIRGIYFQWFVFIVAAGFAAKDILKKLVERTSQMKASELWIAVIYLANLLIFFLYFSSMVDAPYAPYISGAIAFSLILYLIGAMLLYRNKTDELFLIPAARPAAKRLSESDAQLWLAKLDRLMREKAVYTNADLKLGDLSKEIQISSHQLSQLLNDELGKNFTTYINEFRIEEACRILSSDYRFTLESVGYEVGFNSKSTFFTAFKKFKGVTPAVYQQQQVQPALLKRGQD